MTGNDEVWAARRRGFPLKVPQVAEAERDPGLEGNSA